MFLQLSSIQLLIEHLIHVLQKNDLEEGQLPKISCIFLPWHTQLSVCENEIMILPGKEAKNGSNTNDPLSNWPAYIIKCFGYWTIFILEK
jgi:hypothetical protein